MCKLLSFNKNCVRIKKEQDVTVLSFIPLEKYDLIQGFSTKLGGVSKGDCATMNLSFSRGDDYDDVKTNHLRLAGALGYNVDDLVLTKQVHGDVVQIVGKEYTGEVFDNDRKIKDTDALVTNESGVVLMSLVADCVPILLYDPFKKVIANIHSGWRGTALMIGKKAVEKMVDNFASDPKDIIGIIGPSICEKCYEISLDLYHDFSKNFTAEDLKKIFIDNEGDTIDQNMINNRSSEELKNMHAKLDLWRANEIVLHKAGLADDNIYISGVCTCCNHELLFSHRYTKGRRGNLAAVIGMPG